MVEDTRQISFRVTEDEYKHFEKIAGVATLAKALMFIKINEFIQIELMQKDIDARDEALKARNVPAQGHGYL